MDLIEPNNNIFYGENGELYEYMDGSVFDYLSPFMQHQYRNEGYITQPRYCEGYPSYGDGYFNYKDGGLPKKDSYSLYHGLKSREVYEDDYIERRHTGPEYRKFYGTDAKDDETKEKRGNVKVSSKKGADLWDDWDTPLYSQALTSNAANRTEILSTADINTMSIEELEQWLNDTSHFQGDWWYNRRVIAEDLLKDMRLIEKARQRDFERLVYARSQSLMKGLDCDEYTKQLYYDMVRSSIQFNKDNEEALRVQSMHDAERLAKLRRTYY